MIEFINYYFIPGLVLGSIYALAAVGVSLVFGIMRFANFAHGELMMIGGYIAYSLTQFTGLYPLLLLIPAMALTAGVTVGVDRLFFKPLRNSKTIILVMASFGVALMLRSLVQLIWGVEAVSFSTGVIQKPMELAGGLRIQSKHIIIIALSLGLMLLTHIILNHTKMGKAMRAVSDSPELARLTGIDTERVVQFTWILAAMLATAAGFFAGFDSQINSRIGFIFLLPAFAAAILGGIGSPYGAMIGGLVIGLAEELATYHWIGNDSLLSPGYKTGVAFAIMVLILLVRPQGILKGKSF
ncbi:MAG: branched-chain amino acid ABC transporter permease [Alphaproteobacteria bacterium]